MSALVNLRELLPERIEIGSQLIVVPATEGRFLVFESSVHLVAITFEKDRFDIPGDSSILGTQSVVRGVKCEVSNFNPVFMIFENIEALTDFMKKRANKLWPTCRYCFVRFGCSMATKCSSCGAPRGEEDF